MFDFWMDTYLYWLLSEACLLTNFPFYGYDLIIPASKYIPLQNFTKISAVVRISIRDEYILRFRYIR